MLQSFNDWLNAANSSFWPLLLITLLLYFNTSRVAGIVLVFLRCMAGEFMPMHYAVVIAIILWTWLYQFKEPNSIMDKVTPKKEKTNREDPDYK